MSKNMPVVSPYSTSLCRGNAYWMARLSHEVYLKVSERDQRPDEEKILRNLRRDDDGFREVYGFDKNSAQAAVVEHKEYLCLVFRGTNELEDWLDNINAFPVQHIFGEFHRGFWNSVGDLWKKMDKRLRKLQKKKPRPVFITGHSLGGAMATIAAARLVHEDRPFTGVYTFGQPRAMARNSARTFNVECKSRFFRFHNNNDIVTRAPARLMGYSHVGTYLYICTDGLIHPETGFWFRFVDYIDGAVDNLRNDGLDIIKDHSMDKYLGAVEKWKFKSDETS